MIGTRRHLGRPGMRCFSGVLGFNWNEATAEQIWDEMFSAGYGLIMSFNDAPIEEIWGETIVGEEDLFFGWDEMFFLF